MDKSKPVMITGATGYVAGQLVKKLLENGHTVHAPVRSPEKPEKIKFLKELAESLPGSIKFFKADLLKEGSYEEATEGCEVIFHTASPFHLKGKDPMKDFVEPAVKGTTNVLDTANKIDSIKKVILTSSCAAIYGDNIDLQSIPNQTLTEDNWNTTSTLTHQSYSYSKTEAEKKAWEMAGAQDRWKLVVMNPSLVLGPAINSKATSGSFDIINQMLDGTMKMGCPPFRLGMVDVRDLADAHYNGAFLESANGRNIISNQTVTILEMAEILSKKYGDRFPFPKKELPKWLVTILGSLTGQATYKELKKSLGYPWSADNSKSKKDLNLSYRPLETTLNDMIETMINQNAI